MKTRKILKNFLTFLICFAVLCSFSISYASEAELAQAESIAALRAESDKQERYNRLCDYKTGCVLETYDTKLNGFNDVDYTALATSMSMTPDDRIKAMRFLITIYDIVSPEEQFLLKDYIISYAKYTDDEELNAFCDLTKANQIQPMWFQNYNREAAIEYARNWYNGFNTNMFPNISDIGGDCTNFVSQCLLAGEWPMDNVWYIQKLASCGYERPADSQELDAGWKLANPSPWISAKQFNNYWGARSTVYEYSTTNYINNHASIFTQNIQRGDVIQLLIGVSWWYEARHTMIITNYGTYNNTADFLYSAHSDPAYDKPVALGCVSWIKSYSSVTRIQLMHLPDVV